MKKLLSNTIRKWILFPPVILYVIAFVLIFVHAFTDFLASNEKALFIFGAISMIWLLLSIIIVAMVDYERVRIE